MRYVAIVGRPNVGKSTLFNYLAGQRISIVDDTPGVTRDRIYADVEWTGHRFTLVDTGGIDTASTDLLLKDMRLQAEVAIAEADLILFLTDGRQGVTASDEEVARILRNTKKPILLAVNKLDEPRMFNEAHEFYGLGLGDPIPVSAANGMNLGDLLDLIVTNMPEEEEPDYPENTIKIAVIGRPNVGKSSLVNAILGQNRSIVSDIPGTTRDAIDTYFERDGQRYVIVDTAGLRKKNRIEDGIERYSVVRSLRAVDKSDICFMLLDPTEGVIEQDKKIVGYAHDKGKGIIFVINKWDLVDKEEHTTHDMTKDIHKDIIFCDYAPTIFVSARTGQRVHRTLELAKEVYAEQNKRVSIPALNELVKEATLTTPPPTEKGRRLRIGYVTQAEGKPPTFIFFVNDPELMHFSYKRFLENRIRAVYGFKGTPIRLISRKKDIEE